MDPCGFDKHVQLQEASCLLSQAKEPIDGFPGIGLELDELG